MNGLGLVLYLRGVERGYCDQCREATDVGIIAIREWEHKVRICPKCIGNMATKITETARGLNKQEDHPEAAEGTERQGGNDKAPARDSRILAR